MVRLIRLALVLTVVAPLCLYAQPATNAEQRAAQALEAARKAGDLDLHAFLAKMPKGGDLHMHLSGAVYAETFLRDAAEDGLCVDTGTLSLLKNAGNIPSPTQCGAGKVPAASAFQNQGLYDELIDAFSMRTFVPKAGIDGHDQFFSTFDRFAAIGPAHWGEWLDEVATRAAAQNEQYLEVMMTPSTLVPTAIRLGEQIGWPMPLKPVSDAASSEPEAPSGANRTQLAAMREKLLAAGLRDEAATERAELDRALAQRNRIEHCGQTNAAPACSVQIRVLFQVLRAFPPQQVLAQTILAFEVASSDPNVVGLNFVQPEDSYMAMSEYHRQMLMLDYLHSVYPKVHISLHAGELAPGMVPPAGLKFHIRQAVDLGHAERIGHGVDAMYEDDPKLLLKELADRHTMIEINLTSNDVILGVTAAHHPLPDYRSAHVPVALSTDDEGVSRIDLTHEYERAVLSFNLEYLDLKAMARTSIEHSFLPGASLWAKPDQFTAVNPACSGQPLGAENPNESCTTFLKANPRAAEQWELEHRYKVFEEGAP